MSISLLLVPFALPVVGILRVAMGKEKFENMISSSEVRMYTNFKDKQELLITVKKAGYDAINLGDVIKTHIGGISEFFLWEKSAEGWDAVFTKSNSQEMIKNFIIKLEKSAGRRIIYFSIKDMKEGHKELRTIDDIPALPKINEQIFPTNFVSKDLLIKTLEEYGTNGIELENGDIQCNIENYILNFHKGGKASYDLEIKGASPLKNIYQHLTTIDEEYKQNVQEYTYKKVVEKLKTTDMNIENEEVMEDNSIILTVNIEG